CTKVKDFLKAIEDQYVRSDKALASTLMKRLSDVKYNGSRSVREHIMHMRDIAAQLKPLEVDISEPFLVHLILNSLPKEYGPFKITYNAQKEKWSVNELLTMCVQEEERLKNENIEVANLVTQNKGKGKRGKFGRTRRKQGFLSLRKPMGSEQSIYSGNQMRSQVEAVGTFRLVFNNGYVLDLKGKQTNKSNKGAKRSSTVLELIHTDICGPFPPCFNGQRYFVSFIDDYSRYMYLYLIFDKSEAFDAFKAYKVEVEKQLEKSIKIVRSDRGGEYYGRYTEKGQNPGPFAAFLKEEGIIAQYTMPGTPQQNGVAEKDEIVRLWTCGSNIPRKEVFEEDQVSSKTLGELTVYPDYPPSIKGKQSNQEQSPTKDNENVEPSTLNNQNQDENVEVRRSSRVKKSAISSDYIVYLQESDFDIGLENDPTSFSQAMSSENFNLWHNAMKEEIIYGQNQVWELIKGVNLLVVNGSIRPIHLVKSRGIRPDLLLKVILKRGVTPNGCENGVLKWDLEEEENVDHQCIYLKVSGSKYIFLVLYVDDILLASSDMGLLHETKVFLAKNFEMKDMGEASYVIGIEIHRDRSKRILGLSQKAYIEKVLAKFRMSACSSTAAPIVKGDKFGIHQSPQNSLEENQMKNVPYASVVGSLMYVQVCTRPDIAFAVGMLGRYQSNPGIEHWKAAKKVMRYLQGTKDLQLIYKHTENLEVVGYSDSDFAGCLDTRKSTSGYIFLLANGAISWKSTKQTITASSTMEAEFVACYEATSQALWLRHFHRAKDS
ncbi:UNVERIFIED_CONTAM: Retrovirus-related Pol polyprotein from transposon TNT 1-94, partial [Sesamum angustifolium]